MARIGTDPAARTRQEGSASRLLTMNGLHDVEVPTAWHNGEFIATGVGSD